MSLLQISQGVFHLSDTHTITIPALTIRQTESWAFIGANGSGKSALSRALAGELSLIKGSRECSFSHISRLSFEQLKTLINDEWQRNNTDLIGVDEEDTGSTTADIIQHRVKHAARCEELAALFGISHLLLHRFKYLSTGESRKALICQALMPQPDLLILDEPFEGLDKASRTQLTLLLATLIERGHTLVLVLNRFNDIPDFVHSAGVVADCCLLECGEKSVLLQQALITQLAHSETLTHPGLPETDIPRQNGLADNTPLILLRNGVVTYNDHPVLHNINWCVNTDEHWHIVGPNGAGKSTLLNLITGDHPQGFSNDLTLFGRRRGSGETIQDIKKHIGYVSNSLHLDYRINISARNVILSGYFDSIGVYQAVSDRQQHLTRQWLDRIGMNDDIADTPFHALSWGQQRLVLIVRALVKHPTLLILDEPLQGLDSLNRQLVRRFIDILIAEGKTQLIFVSHYPEDAPDCITHRLTFMAEGKAYRYCTQPISPV